MIKIDYIDESFDKVKADFEVIFVIKEDLSHRFIDKDDFKLCQDFKNPNLLLVEKKRLYIALEELNLDSIRVGVFKAIKALKNLKIKSFKIHSYLTEQDELTFVAYAEGALFGAYEFDLYKSEKSKLNLSNIYICKDEFNNRAIDSKMAKAALKKGEIMASSANFAKDRVNEIPNSYTPEKMANDAKEVAKRYKEIECVIHDKEFLQKENMNAFLAVNRSSANPPYLIHLIYKPKEAKKRVIFVGKGLTYDSGGLSLKPSNYMVTMKSDKSGAMAAMAIVEGACKLKLPFEIHAILGATENMIGGNSYKPDDVLISRSKTTIEVRNTDAEGRLVLADCLSYAQDFKPDILIDLATLTGACVVGLGEYTAGIMGNNAKLKEKFKALSKDSGELYTILEFNPYLKELIKSNVADISNTSSSSYGGAITAGLFLERFIKKEYKDCWIHLDIAGPAYLEKAWGYNSFGASGAGVRACLYFLDELKKEL